MHVTVGRPINIKGYEINVPLAKGWNPDIADALVHLAHEIENLKSDTEVFELNLQKMDGLEEHKMSGSIGYACVDEDAKEGYYYIDFTVNSPTWDGQKIIRDIDAIKILMDAAYDYAKQEKTYHFHKSEFIDAEELDSLSLRAYFISIPKALVS